MSSGDGGAPLGDEGAYGVEVPEIEAPGARRYELSVQVPADAAAVEETLRFQYTTEGVGTVEVLTLAPRPRTEARLEIFRYDPASDEAPTFVPTPQYCDPAGTCQAVAELRLWDQMSRGLADHQARLTAAQSFRTGEPVFIRLTDPDQNVDPAEAEWATVTLEVPGTGDRETLRLAEVDEDAGEFLGYLGTSGSVAARNDGWLQVEAGSTIRVAYEDGVSAADVAEAEALVDPYGLVFSSRTGEPLDGVQITLVDADTGLPAQVFGDDGVSAFPSTVTAGAGASDAGGTRYEFPPGSYRFPLVPPGRYRLSVHPPPESGLAWPSELADGVLQSLPGSPFALTAASRGEAFDVEEGPPLQIDLPLDPGDSPLFLRKTAGKETVGAGDFLSYTVEVENATTLVPATRVVVTDLLPPGFRYEAGSARRDGLRSPDPEVSRDGRTLTFELGDLEPGDAAEVRYVVRVGAAGPGKARNTATATAEGGLGSNTATATVTVREELFRSRNVLVGRVGMAEPLHVGPDLRWAETAEGVPGVRVYLEDGSYVVTDGSGRYHFEGVRPGTHVVQLDLDTLPEGVEVIPFERSTRFAGRAWSKFVDLRGGTLWRVDFHVVRTPAPAPEPASGAEPAGEATPTPPAPPRGAVGLRLASSLEGEGEVQAFRVHLEGSTVPVTGRKLLVMLPPGARYLEGSSALAGEALGDPDVQGAVLTYRLPDREGDWEDELSFRVRLPAEGAEEELISKALLLFDTPAARGQRTPVAENALLRRTVQAGRKVHEFRLRPTFPSGSAELQESDRADLDRLVEQLGPLENPRVQLIGHSDSLPISPRIRAKYRDNYALSEARALSVGRYLMEKLGLTPAQVFVLGKGPDEPVAGNDTPEGRAANRRVDVRIVADEPVRRVRLEPVKTESPVQRVETEGPAPAAPPAAPEAKPPEAEAGSPGASHDARWLETATPGLEWVSPPAGYLPPIPSVHIQVKHRPGDQITLLLDGRPVSPLNFEETIVNSRKTAALSRWRGVDLEEGDNRFEVVARDKSGAETGRIVRTIHCSGPPVEARLLERASVLVADGIEPVVIAVQLLDRDGQPARQGTVGEFRVAPPYRAAERADRRLEAMPGAPEQRPTYTVGADGVALLELEPTTEGGTVQLRIPMADGREEELSVRLRPKPRDWILVGFAEGTAGYRTIRGNQTSLTGDAGNDRLWTDGRVAFYAKGAIQGKWLLTAAYDSGKPTGTAGEGLFQTIDPDRFYPVYGDTTRQRYDAPSSEKLYVKLEREAFYALFGDYAVGLTETELARYDRSVTGLKSAYENERYKVILFATETDQAFVKDEIRGRGITGPYRLSRRNLVANSEKVTVQVRDRFRSEIIHSEEALERHRDYDIDYEEGRITFREPVFSTDPSLNPVFIVVDYESFDAHDDAVTFGGRVQVEVVKGLRLGATHVEEGTTGADGRLTGVDVEYEIVEGTTFRAEYAHSTNGTEGSGGSDDAYLAEIEHRSKRVDATAYYREAGEGFGLGQLNDSETGTRKIGAEGTVRVTEHVDLRAQAYRQKQLGSRAERDLGEAAVDVTFGETTLSAGVRAVRDTLDSGEERGSDLLTVAARQRWLNERLTLRAEREQALGGRDESLDFPNRTRLGADYLVGRSTSLFAEQEWTDGGERDTQTTRAGVKTSPWRGAEAFTAVSRNAAGGEAGTVGTAGVHQRWKVNDRWSVDAGVEHQRVLSGGGAEPLDPDVPFASGGGVDFVATSLGATYDPGPWLWTGRTELRLADDRDEWSLATSAQTEVTSELGLLASLTLSDDNEDGGAHDFRGDARLGLAYRPDHGPWTLLDRLDLIREARSGTDDGFRNWRLVNNLWANYKAARWQIAVGYGCKFVRETVDGRPYWSFTDLVGLETRYDVAETWDVGLRGGLLHGWDVDQYDYSLGVSVGHTPLRNVWLSLGYNLVGFEDEDFSAAGYTSRGPFVQVRAKFDQQTVREAAAWAGR
ncbi:MAG: hypothetical protein Kow0092_32880 [Deferrisomatales bacterium]